MERPASAGSQSAKVALVQGEDVAALVPIAQQDHRRIGQADVLVRVAAHDRGAGRDVVG